MFSFCKPSGAAIQNQIEAARGTPPASPRLLSIADGLLANSVGSYAHDHSRSNLGAGASVFNAAKRAFTNWQMFDLGWVRVANASAPIVAGQIIAVEVHSLALWSINLSRILETIDSETQFGFLYSTTAHHVEQGEEAFLLRIDPATAEVMYELEAVSRPRAFLANTGFPITRYFQHKFARDSHRRMRQAVNLEP